MSQPRVFGPAPDIRMSVLYSTVLEDAAAFYAVAT